MAALTTVSTQEMKLDEVLTIPVGYAKCFDARGVAGKVLIAFWAETR